MFPPFPDTFNVVVQSPGGAAPTWLELWGPTLVPLLVSLVALGGVIFANWRTGKNMIAAERERARLAEIAEDKRAAQAIAADDRRAKAAIEAEDRRHANDLRRATHDHMVDSIRDLYGELESARRELQEASYPVSFFQSLEEWDSRPGREYKAEFEQAAREFSRVRDKASLLGSENVDQLAAQIAAGSFDILFTADVMSGEMDYPAMRVTFDQFQEKHTAVREDCRKLLRQMREELHREDPRPTPANS